MKFNKTFSLLFEQNLDKEIDKEKNSIIKTISMILDNPQLDYYINRTRLFTDTTMIFLGKHGNCPIYLINGNIVKTKMWPDFVEGGNDEVYGTSHGEIAKFMPDNHIWVDAEINSDAIPYILFHELIERYMMFTYHYNYEQAHEVADTHEMQMRKDKLFEHMKTSIEFPYSRQPNGYTCGHCISQMLLKYYDKDVRLDEISDLFSVKENSYGLTPQMIVKVLKKFKVDTEIRENVTIEDVKNYIDIRIPVIVEFQAWNKNTKILETKNTNGHYAVIIGYTPNHFIFSDPSTNSKAYMKIEDFDKRWHDINNGKKDIRLAIVPVNGKSDYSSEKAELIENKLTILVNF